ncbi:hypothetical protein ACGFNU_33150 [Spirillospora sp. NPDC048911]|uniref:hypothetical protein n=1 Tax=Spirillospora sp. NPDC048911 TaxID=3364527 RepID=UPI0037243DEE
MRETLLKLWNLTPVRLAVRLANTGLNLVTARDLITALTRADLGLILIAIAWLIPWDKVALLAYGLIRQRRPLQPSTAKSVPTAA